MGLIAVYTMHIYTHMHTYYQIRSELNIAIGYTCFVLTQNIRQNSNQFYLNVTFRGLEVLQAVMILVITSFHVFHASYSTKSLAKAYFDP